MGTDLKLVGLAAFAAAAGLGVAIAENPIARHMSATSSYPPGCVVALGGGADHLPRAGVTIENRLGHPVQAWLVGRVGMPRVDFGWIGAGESRVRAHTLPAGRNLLHAAGDQGVTVRAVLTVANRGAGTCQRRYLWRIEEAASARVLWGGSKALSRNQARLYDDSAVAALAPPTWFA